MIIPVSPTFFLHRKHLFFFGVLVEGVVVRAWSSNEGGVAWDEAGKSERGVA